MAKNTKAFLIIVFIISFILKILRVELNLINLPILILSSLIPIVFFFLIKEIDQKSEKLAFISTILLTLNPYNIYFSDITLKTNFFLFLLLLMMWLVSKYFHIKNNKFLLPILIIIPLIFNLIFIDNNSGLYPQDQHRTQTIINETNSLDYYIFYNPIQLFLRNFTIRYLNYFSPEFLIFGNTFANPRHGTILYPSIIFLILGIFISFSSKKKQKINLIFLIWLLIAPISAALSPELINSNKAFFMSIPLVYFISIGIYFILNKYKNKLVYFSIIFIYLLSLIYYLDMYLNHFIK
ncbi:MAG: hypothetical protein WCG91_02030 [Candidatus Shapirobacteria bacterium]